MDNYYTVLGVSETATPEVIAIAYEGKLRALKREPSPKAGHMAEEKALREAYRVLSDPRRRERYDAQLAAAEERAAQGSGRGALVMAVVLGVGAVGGIGWYLADRSARLEQIRLQEERLAREAEAARRRAAAEEKLRTRQGLDAAIEEHKARKREEEERVRIARERRALELEVIRRQVEAERAADIERNKRR